MDLGMDPVQIKWSYGIPVQIYFKMTFDLSGKVKTPAM